MYLIVLESGTELVVDTTLLMATRRKFPFGLLYWLDNYLTQEWITIEKMS